MSLLNKFLPCIIVLKQDLCCICFQSSISMLKYMVKKTGVDIPFGSLKLETLKKALELLEQLGYGNIC